MGKRKRAAEADGINSKVPSTQLRNGTGTIKKAKTEASKPFTVQIVVGTYERILHGIAATVTAKKASKGGDHDLAVQFADTFLFNAHSSAIRCLALSPIKQDKITLASGGSDQTVNLYQLSAREPSTRVDHRPPLPSLAGRTIVENPRNRELGSLQHHAASVNALKFPTRSKLLSAADDNTIAVARTRDWTVLSTIKIPIPKAHGRPSGDTAPLGGTPAGVNDLAIHPSMKLMVSVSKGEKCMRLWNLVTGKKAGVLNFDKTLLQAVGEGRWGRGEGARVEWNSPGEEFVVAFEKGAVVFGLDSEPKGIVKPSPPSKIHQIHYIDDHGTNDEDHSHILALSTEDGRVVFYSTKLAGNRENVAEPNPSHQISMCPAIGEIRGWAEGSGSRVKDFELLKVPGTESMTRLPLVVTASSEGSVAVWALDLPAILKESASLDDQAGLKSINPGGDGSEVIQQVGRLLGKYETGNRITCLKAFIMVRTPEEEEEDASRSALADHVDANRDIEETSGSGSD